MASHSLNSLKRWSCADAELPSVESIKSLHVYDFDNTLFASPLPNKLVWQGSTIGMLQGNSQFKTGGWWHDSNFLKATGEGMDIEEKRGWAGWWNEQIVDLVQLSMQQKDALNVLLTGRSERGFADVIQRMVKSRKLEFDLIVLRPEMGPANQHYSDTMAFKQGFLRDLIDTYSAADEIRLYEDRVKHVAKFREFFEGIRKAMLSSPTASRKPIKGDVIEVAENALNLDPLAEIAAVQRMLNTHNTAYAAGTLAKTAVPYELKRLVLYTGYLLTPTDTSRLITLAKLPGSPSAYHTMANNVMITPRPCPAHILDKVGGLGRVFRWKTVALGCFDNRVWAVRVEPVPIDQAYYSETPVPVVVLATKGAGKPTEANRITQWEPLPPDEIFEFDTTVGEKALLRIEQERRRIDDPTGINGEKNANGKRRPAFDEDDFPPLGGQQKPSGGHGQGQRRDFSTSRQGGQQRGRGGGQRGGGQNRGRGGSQRGRGAGGPSGSSNRGRGGHGAHSGGKQSALSSFGGDGANDGGLTY